jgi:indolepyruvate ferredoxin oxidoreductase beta subunit
MTTFNIYMTGVGGQGIGLLSEVLLRAADHAGLAVKSVDTHGLAQRGGIVVSQLRVGPQAHSPLIPAHQADMVVSLERHEALRAAQKVLKPGGVLIYYDAVWQPLPVRLGKASMIDPAAVDETCARIGARLIRLHQPDLRDARMQNMVMLAHIHRLGLIPGLTAAHYQQALEDLLKGSVLTENLALFHAERQGTL